MSRFDKDVVNEIVARFPSCWHQYPLGVLRSLFAPNLLIHVEVQRHTVDYPENAEQIYEVTAYFDGPRRKQRTRDVYNLCDLIVRVVMDSVLHARRSQSEAKFLALIKNWDQWLRSMVADRMLEVRREEESKTLGYQNDIVDAEDNIAELLKVEGILRREVTGSG